MSAKKGEMQAQGIVQFDHIVQQEALNHEKKLAIDAQIEYVVPSKLLTDIENKQDNEVIVSSAAIVENSGMNSSSDDETDMYSGSVKSHRRFIVQKVCSTISMSFHESCISNILFAEPG